MRLFHIYAIDEDVEMAKTVTVDISTLFIDLVPTEMNEMSLTANRPVKDVHLPKWNIANEKENKETKKEEVGDFKVVLAPMEIKTFLVRFQRK